MSGDGFATTRASAPRRQARRLISPEEPCPKAGLTREIGVSGTADMSGSTTTQDVEASSYGVSGGLVAIF